MKITQQKPIDLGGYLTGAAGAASKVSTKDDKVSDKGDRIDVSEKAKVLQKAKNAVDASPDVREEKVAELKNAIDKGSYNVSGEEIAGSLIKKSIVDIVL
ncbi:MAG: flagellar biosynthesis anti-sigma factor FlgM [Deltaproteobacteria bacterium]|nr:flagellar biosynthesis anti-sigma factor FlgM [Deltaproteobacteria bacterium]